MSIVESWPSVDGQIVSAVASFRRTHSFKGMVELNTAIADYTAARPLIYTTMDSDKAFDQRHVYREMLSGAAGGQAAVGMFSKNSYPAAPFLAGEQHVAEDTARSMLLGSNETMRSVTSAHEAALQQVSF